MASEYDHGWAAATSLPAASCGRLEGVAPEPEFLGPTSLRLERRRDEPFADGGDLAPPRPLPRWQRLTITVLGLAVATGWYVDHRIAQHESGSVDRCDALLLEVTRAYDGRMGAMFNYLRPSLGSGSPRDDRLLLLLMYRPARHVLPSARVASARCRSVDVLPWHSSNLARRDADVAYSAALVQRLQGVASRQALFRFDDRYLTRLRATAGIPVALGP